MPAEDAFNLAAVVLLFLTLGVAAVTDLLHKKVYNWTTLPAMVFGLTLSYAAEDVGGVSIGPGGSGLLDHLAGLFCGFLVFFVYWTGGVGGGDLKLMAAIGALMGLHFVVGAMFWSALVGAVMALWILLLRGKLWWGIKRTVRQVMSVRAEPPAEEDPVRARLPYGVAISFGTTFAFFLMELPQR